MSTEIIGGPRATTARPGRCDCCGAPLRTVRGDRRFTLMDGMILVAASAVAFAIVRPMVDGPLAREPGWARFLAAMVGGLVAGTPAVLLLRLRGPRPTIRRMSRRPGFVASVAGTAILALGAAAMVVLAIARAARRSASIPMLGPAASGSDPSWWLGVVVHFGAIVGPAVIAAWVVLAVGGRRRPSRDWLDLLSRAIGAAWVVLFVIYTCVHLAFLAT